MLFYNLAFNVLLLRFNFLFDENRIAVGWGASNIKNYLARQLMACRVLTPLRCNGCDYGRICFLTGHVSVRMEFDLAVWRLIPVGNGI